MFGSTVEMKNVPPGVTDYLLLLFTSDKGRISGKARIQGSDIISSFSTTVNNKIQTHPKPAWFKLGPCQTASTPCSQRRLHS
jgi:hypothetical protein